MRWRRNGVDEEQKARVLGGLKWEKVERDLEGRGKRGERWSCNGKAMRLLILKATLLILLFSMEKLLTPRPPLPLKKDLALERYFANFQLEN